MSMTNDIKHVFSGDQYGEKCYDVFGLVHYNSRYAIK